ncbi:MAG: protein translocase subunit SecF [Candidatus Pacebacteria bacterium]|nr:protein translocase subunit SecF [Candidatus Paceibacterota bacterium]
MFITQYRKWFIGFSVLLVIAGIAIVGTKGLDYGIEFTGGSVLEVSYDTRPDIDTVRESLNQNNFEDILLQPFGDTGYVLRTEPITEEKRRQLVSAMRVGESEMSIERYNAIGPSVGRQLRVKSLYALIAVSLGIILFVAYAFRKVTYPVSSWKYGVVAVIALLHDIIIPIGILTLLGIEVDTLYVVGLLSILGLSVNDTIVVFDRIREALAENQEKNKKEDFIMTVGGAIKDTITRSIFTSLTLIVVLLVLYLKGPAATQTLSLVLLLGTLVGTYSSIFLASPLLTFLVSKKEEKK